MRKQQLSPQMQHYWEIRYQKLVEEIREAARELGMSDPIPTREERVWIKQNLRSVSVDVIGAK